MAATKTATSAYNLESRSTCMRDSYADFDMRTASLDLKAFLAEAQLNP
jgi:hypothetical protein